MAEKRNILREMFVKVGLIGDKDSKRKLGMLRGAIKSMVGDIKVFQANLAAIGVSSMFRGISNGFSFVIRKTKELFVESAKLAGQQEEAERRLESALRIAGQFSDMSFRGLKDFANGLQEASIFGDEEILSGLSLAVALGASAEQAKNLVAAAADFASITGRGFDESVRQTVKTLGGYAGELGEAIPELKELTQEQLQAGKAAELMTKQFGGAALDRVNTFSGGVSRLMGVVGDAFQVVGKQLTAAILPAIVQLRSYIQAMTPDFARLGDKLAQTAGVILRIFEGLGGENLLKDSVKFIGDMILDIALLVEDLILFLSGKDSFIGKTVLGGGNLLANISKGFTDMVTKLVPPILEGVGNGVQIFLSGIMTETGQGIKDAMKGGYLTFQDWLIEEYPRVANGLRALGQNQMDREAAKQSSTTNNLGGNVINFTSIVDTADDVYQLFNGMLTGAGQELEVRGR